MKTSKEWNTLIFQFILLIIAYKLNAQNQVLTKINGGTHLSPSSGCLVNVRAKLNSNQTIPSGQVTTVVFSTEDYDVNGTFNTSSGILTVPLSGYYVITASVNWDNSNTTHGIRSIRLVKNNTVILEQTEEEGSGAMHSSIHTVVYANGFDDFRIQVSQNSGINHDITGSTSPGDGSTFTAFNLMSFNQNVAVKDGGGMSWSNDIKSCVRATRTSSFTIPHNSATKLTYTSEDFDLNNDFDPSTGVFTPPQAGTYVIMASADWAPFSGSGTPASAHSIRLMKNGSQTVNTHSEHGWFNAHSSLHTIIESDGSDNYSITLWQNSGLMSNQPVVRSSFVAYRVLDEDRSILTEVDGGMTLYDASMVRAKRTSYQSIPSGTLTKVNYSAEEIDANGEFDPATGIFSPKQAGYYLIMATIDWSITNNGTLNERSIYLRKRLNASSTELQKANFVRNRNSLTSSLHTVVYYDGTSGQNYFIEAFQNSGLDHQIGGSSSFSGCYFTVYRLF